MFSNLIKKPISWLVLAVIVFAAIGIVSMKSCSNEKQEVKQLESQQAPDALKVTKDKTGQTIAEAPVTQVSPEVLQSILAQNQSLKADVKNVNNALEVMQLKFADAGSFRAPIIDTVFYETHHYYHATPDTQRVSAKSFHWRDKWLSASGLIVNDSISLDYNIQNDVNLVTSWKRSKLFAPLTLTAQMVTDNPHISPQTLRTYSVSRPTKWYQTRGFAFAAGMAVGLFSESALLFGLKNY